VATRRTSARTCAGAGHRFNRESGRDPILHVRPHAQNRACSCSDINPRCGHLWWQLASVTERLFKQHVGVGRWEQRGQDEPQRRTRLHLLPRLHGGGNGLQGRRLGLFRRRHQGDIRERGLRERSRDRHIGRQRQFLHIRLRGLWSRRVRERRGNNGRHPFDDVGHHERRMQSLPHEHEPPHRRLTPAYTKPPGARTHHLIRKRGFRTPGVNLTRSDFRIPTSARRAPAC